MGASPPPLPFVPAMSATVPESDKARFSVDDLVSFRIIALLGLQTER